MGRENLVFETGSFTYFGMQALTQNIGVGEIKLGDCILCFISFSYFYLLLRWLIFCSGTILLVCLVVRSFVLFLLSSLYLADVLFYWCECLCLSLVFWVGRQSKFA